MAVSRSHLFLPLLLFGVDAAVHGVWRNAAFEMQDNEDSLL
ncbi:MAG: hypothetical protein QM579_07100 [Desulfovibrio sp.]